MRELFFQAVGCRIREPLSLSQAQWLLEVPQAQLEVPQAQWLLEVSQAQLEVPQAQLEVPQAQWLLEVSQAQLEVPQAQWLLEVPQSSWDSLMGPLTVHPVTIMRQKMNYYCDVELVAPTCCCCS